MTPVTQDSASPEHELVLGIDIGGSGMKGAVVDPQRGQLASDRRRIDTPRPATPEAMRDVFGEILDHFEWTGPVGCTFPGVVRRHAVIETAANLDPSWIGVDAAELFGSCGTDVLMINDADAAGIAELQFGAGRGVDGVVFMLTIGTGFGTAIFNDGVLLPNVELGHIEIDGVDAEELATSRALKEQNLTRAQWCVRLERYLQTLEALINPDLFIIGGGISKTFDDFGPRITTRAQMVPAEMRNQAGIVGAALAVRSARGATACSSIATSAANGS